MLVPRIPIGTHPETNAARSRHANIRIAYFPQTRFGWQPDMTAFSLPSPARPVNFAAQFGALGGPQKQIQCMHHSIPSCRHFLQYTHPLDDPARNLLKCTKKQKRLERSRGVYAPSSFFSRRIVVSVIGIRSDDFVRLHHP